MPTAAPPGQPVTMPPAQEVIKRPSFLHLFRKKDFEAIPFQGLLARELLCQAFLLAAREGLGLETQNAALGDPCPEDSPATIQLSASVAPLGKQALVTVECGSGTNYRQLDTLSIPLEVDGQIPDYSKLLEAAEALSRKEFPKNLAQLGFSGIPIQAKGDVAVPEATEKRLGQMAFTAQFAAVRELHAAMRAQGESHQLIGALVRGYANLGLLTEFYWNSMHKVFKARALLYGQRLVAAAPQSPWSLWHRAYASALAGLHQLALADLAQARRLSQASAKESPVVSQPVWVNWLEAYCHFDIEKLDAVRDSAPQSQLARLLWFFTLADSSSVNITVEAAGKLLESNPLCFRVHDAANEVGGVSHLHTASLAGLATFLKTVSRELRELPGLPPNVVKLLQEEAAPAAIIQALVEAGKPDNRPGELSWAVLGRMMQETLFTQVYRRLAFMRDVWSVPVDEFLNEARPLVAQHPYEPFLRSFELDRQRQKENLAQLLQGLKLIDIELTALPVARAWKGLDQYRPRQIYQTALSHQDETYRDLQLAIDNSFDQEKGKYAQRLLKVSPHSPLARATLIRHDWEFAKSKLPEWEKSQGSHPTLLAALSERYGQLGRDEDAIRCLKQYIVVSPDQWAYKSLAEHYKKKGDLAKWQESLEAFLRQEDYGLGHAQVRVELARHFMKLGQWKKAQPYAEAAAETWARWAMVCASECAEGVEDWPKAEQWIQRVAERYPEAQMDYYFWCKRTGHGDVQKARALAEEYIEGLGSRATKEDLIRIGCFYVLAKKREPALTAFTEAGRSPPIGAEHFLLALVADDLKKNKIRDEALEQLVATKTPKSTLAGILLETLARDKPFELQKVEAALKKLSPQAAANSCYYVAHVLEKLGRRTEAIAYLERCGTSPERIAGLIPTLAAAALRDRGVEPGQRKAERE